MTNQSPDGAPLTQYLERSGEGTIAYDRQGAGPLVLLVPGMGDLRSTYRFLTPALVAAGYTVVSTDLRGHGDSDAAFASYGDADTAADIEALLDELGQPAVIVGNSMAAGAAVIVAARRPDRVLALVLIGPFVRQPSSGSALGRASLRLLMAPAWAAVVWSAYLPRLYAGRKPSDFAAYRRAVVDSIKRPGFARAFSRTTRTDHRAAGASLESVAAPALVVMGADDPDFANPQEEAAWIASALHGTSVMVADAGHYPHSQQPSVVASAVLDFLANVITRA